MAFKGEHGKPSHRTFLKRQKWNRENSPMPLARTSARKEGCDDRGSWLGLEHLGLRFAQEEHVVGMNAVYFALCQRWAGDWAECRNSIVTR
jgi:hypothetical protein